VPESKGRRKKAFTPPNETPRSVKIGNPSWWVPVMLTLFIVGLIWIVVYYIAGAELPLMKDLGWVNVLVGFGFIFAGFGMATRWR
jgi:hypothetical protein